MAETYLSDSTLVGSERAQLEASVHDDRVEVRRLLDGLTEEQARRRLVPSPTTLLGIVNHACEELRHAGHGDIRRERILASTS